MESTNNNNDQTMFLSEIKELREELSAMNKRIVQLEKSHEEQQEKIDILERENHALKKKTELNNLNGNKAVGSVLKRKRIDQDQDKVHEEETESKSASASSDKKTKTNIDDDEAVVLPLRDNGDSFDSLSDDLLHKIVEFDGNCFAVFGSINKRCKNIYDVEVYKLKKETCLYGYGTLDLMLQHYLQRRREGTSVLSLRYNIARTVISCNRLDAIDWIIQLEDDDLSKKLCWSAARYGRIDILTKVFLKLNVKMLDELLDDASMSQNAAKNGKLEALKWLRNHGAKCDADTFAFAEDEGQDDIVQYLRAEGCPETFEDMMTNEEDGDY